MKKISTFTLIVLLISIPHSLAEERIRDVIADDHDSIPIHIQQLVDSFQSSPDQFTISCTGTRSGCTIVSNGTPAAALVSQSDDTSIGVALYISGRVISGRGEDSVALKKRDQLSQPAYLATGDRARLQLLMRDGTRLSLSPNSSLEIPQFFLQDPHVARMTLHRGRFRSIAGAAFKDAKADVLLQIGDLRIVGIDGDYTVVRCAGDCGISQSAQPVPDGVYIRVRTRSLQIQTEGAIQQLNPGVYHISDIELAATTLGNLAACAVDLGVDC